MAGHSLLNQVRAKSEIIIVDGKKYDVLLSYNKVAEIDGYVVGLKFTDEAGSMDSSIAKSANGIRLSLAIAHRAIQMLKPDLYQVAILGFYLLTDDLDARGSNARQLKMRLYGNQALTIHKAFKDKLAHLAEFEVAGGTAWVLTEKPYGAYEHFNVFENELAKQLRITLC